MSSKAMRELANEYVSMITKYVADRLVPVCAKLDAAITIINDQRMRIDELEARLAEIESKQIRRVA